MKLYLIAAVAAVLSFGTDQTFARVETASSYQSDIAEHGGGCRKSSPPGQCCHMDNSTGTVHCH
jgi:hypothetical protein